MIKFNNIQILVSDKLNIMYEAIHMDIDLLSSPWL